MNTNMSALSGDAQQPDLQRTDLRMQRDALRLSPWIHCISHTSMLCCDSTSPQNPFICSSPPPPPFHHFPMLAVIRGDSNGKSDQGAGGHLTSVVFFRASSPFCSNPPNAPDPTPASLDLQRDESRLHAIDRPPRQTVDRHKSS